MIPANLTLLHQGEETVRTEALRRITASPDMTAHLAMVESGMDLVHSLLPSKEVQDEDQLMLGNLGIRLFNAFAAGVKLLLSGYNQASALQLRDILETVFLLDYFTIDSGLITEWRTMPEAKRKEKFKPFNVRVALDNRDGVKGKKRAEAYALFSKLAGHATPEGMVMLVPVRGGKHVHCGPFLEETALHAVLAEGAKLAIQAAGNFCILMKKERLSQMEARVIYMEAHADWVERFGGSKPDRAAIADCRALIEEARKG